MFSDFCCCKFYDLIRCLLYEFKYLLNDAMMIKRERGCMWVGVGGHMHVCACESDSVCVCMQVHESVCVCICVCVCTPSCHVQSL